MLFYTFGLSFRDYLLFFLGFLSKILVGGSGEGCWEAKRLLFKGDVGMVLGVEVGG